MQIKLLGQFCRWLWTVFWERGFFWNTSANSKSKAVPFHHKSFIYIFFLLLTFTLLFSFFETSFQLISKFEILWWRHSGYDGLWWKYAWVTCVRFLIFLWTICVTVLKSYIQVIYVSRFLKLTDSVEHLLMVASKNNIKTST